MVDVVLTPRITPSIKLSPINNITIADTPDKIPMKKEIVLAVFRVMI